MAFPYKKILVIGATSGIGWALAEKFVQNGIKVIIVGRRKEKLDEFVEKYGQENAEAMVFDITKTTEIPTFAKTVLEANPDLDSVFLNSGIQRAFDFSKPSTVNLNVIEEEVNTNYISYLHLTVAFLPHLQSLPSSSLIFTSSGLALIPLPRCLNYSATKSALHHFILALRDQLNHGPGNVKVIEIFPPAVQTELHDEKHQPDLKDGGKMGMPLAEFTEETWSGLEAGKDQIAIGFVKGHFDSWEQERQKGFAFLSEMARKQGH